ncbi:MAG: hypothetical protein CVV05_09380 [Gammaproteobacteria bacterium HGW-Gammaproteobacteria-1]|jgi:hypothetical protein|nr:MAG: hypothetical protein CVV05_09380 [Gammaproteobacteria bacterium HGW-Gammaproteobacteria-1]
MTDRNPDIERFAADAIQAAAVLTQARMAFDAFAPHTGGSANDEVFAMCFNWSLIMVLDRYSSLMFALDGVDRASVLRARDSLVEKLRDNTGVAFKY